MAKSLKLNLPGTWKVYERDYGYRRIVNGILSLDKGYTKVGLPADGDSPGEHSMEEVIEYGIYNEFGTEMAPARPFIRSAVDRNRKTIDRVQFKAFWEVSEGMKTARQGLADIGRAVVRLIRQNIQNGNFAPLASSTIRKKGHFQPLIDSGQLFNTIQHKEVTLG